MRSQDIAIADCTTDNWDEQSQCGGKYEPRYNVKLKRFKSEENCIKENYTESLPVKVVSPNTRTNLEQRQIIFSERENAIL